MKRFVEIPKILWIVNIVLLVILGYIVAGFIFGSDGGQNSIVESKSNSDGEQITLSNNSVPLENPSIIIERNIFSSSDGNPSQENPDIEIQETSVSALKAQLHLLATVAGDEEVACAVIENLKTKIQDLYRTGDIIEGMKIERIDRNKIILFNGVQREALSLYVADRALDNPEIIAEQVVAQQQDTSDVVNIISPTEREINKRAFLARVGGMEAIIKKVELTPYIEDGKENGVRITGLEDISMARFVGFKNGDVIQNINGSVVTNRRKAFQILRKARSQSSLQVQLLRDQQKKELSFGIK